MTKKITLLVALLIATISYAQNLTSKGDFEDLTAPADLTTTAGAGYWYTTNQSGNPRAAVATDGSNNYGVLKNLAALSRLIYRFDIVTGKTYKLTIKTADEVDNDKELTISIRDSSKESLEGFVPDSQSNALDVVRAAGTVTNGAYAIAFSTLTGTLTEHSVLFTATTTETVDLWFQKNKTEGTGGEIYIDDVVFEEDSNATASLEDLQKFNFSYAPNPTKDFVNLSAANSIKDVQVYNLIGQEVLRKTYNSRNPSIDISELNSGVYVMKVAIDDSIGTFRIIKE